jgi:transposase-like protein
VAEVARPKCPECGSEDVVKDGTRITRKGREQRWLCKHCARNFHTPLERLESGQRGRAQGR